MLLKDIRLRLEAKTVSSFIALPGPRAAHGDLLGAGGLWSGNYMHNSAELTVMDMASRWLKRRSDK